MLRLLLMPFSLSLSLFLKTPSKKAVADIVRTTLGPRAMLKMLLDASGGETEALEMEKEARERGAARDRVFCRRSFHSSFFLPQPISPPQKKRNYFKTKSRHRAHQRRQCHPP